MKIIKLTLLIALLSITFTRKNKGEPCEVGLFDVTIQIDQEESQARFSAKLLKDPTGDNLKGWSFTGTPGALLSKSVIKGDSGFYIPFRQLTIPFSEQSNPAAGKVITTIIELNSATTPEFHTISVKFAFDPKWDVVTDAEFIDILNWLNTARSNRRSYVEQLKITANELASKYIISNDLASKAQGEGNQLATELKNYETKITALNTKNSGLKTKITNNQQAITDKQKEASKASTNQKTAKGKISSLNGDLQSENKIKTDYVNAKNDNVNLISQFDLYIKNYLQKINDLNSLYKEECAFNSALIDSSFNQFKNDFNAKTFSDNLLKALSKN